MPFEPLRFLHAARLRVDHQLEALPQLDDDDAELVEEATATALERVVTAAIEHRVDFVLLAGDSFCAEDKSLRAEVLLRRAFERLADHNIRVFAVAGAADSPSAWRAVRDLPENVTTLLESSDDPVAVIRDGKVIASVAAFDSTSLRASSLSETSSARTGDTQRGPLTLGLLVSDDGLKSHESTSISAISPLLADCTLDYLALGGPGERQSISMKAGLAHHPGATQAISSTETGPHGCTLVELEQGGNLKTTFIPTAVIRRERFDVFLESSSTEQQIIGRVCEIISERKHEPGELIWMFEWSIRGTGPLFDALQNAAARERLANHVDLPKNGTNGIRIIHSFRAARDARAFASSEGDEAMLVDFLATLGSEGGASHDALAKCFAEFAPGNSMWKRALEPLISQLDAESIAVEVRRLGTKWFAPASAEEPAA